MSGDVSVAVITVSGSIVLASVSFFFTKWYERKADWQKRKIEHYTELLVSLSGIVDGREGWNQAQERFADAVNTIALVAPQYVIDALMVFHSCISYTNTDRSPEEDIRFYNRLLLAIRKDIGVAKDDDPDTFFCRLVGVAPPEVQTKRKVE